MGGISKYIHLYLYFIFVFYICMYIYIYICIYTQRSIYKYVCCAGYGGGYPQHGGHPMGGM